MDTSETYIQMCSGASIVQNSWEQTPGDFVANFIRPKDDYEIGMAKKRGRRKKKELSGIIVLDDSYDIKDKSLCVWLPRQDQLQVWVFQGAGNVPNLSFIDTIRDFVADHMDRTGRGFDTYEQMWLSLFMVANVQKLWDWDKKKWIPM